MLYSCKGVLLFTMLPCTRQSFHASGSRGAVQIKASLRNCHFGALDQRSYPVTGHTMAFGTLRHVHRPTTPKGTHYTLLLPVGWGAQVPWGGTMGIRRFPVLCGTSKKKKSSRTLVDPFTAARSLKALAGCDEGHGGGPCPQGRVRPSGQFWRASGPSMGPSRPSDA